MQGRKEDQSQGGLGVLHANCQWPFLSKGVFDSSRSSQYLVEHHGGRRPHGGWE